MSAKIVVHGSDREFVRRIAMMLGESGLTAHESASVQSLSEVADSPVPVLLILDFAPAAFNAGSPECMIRVELVARIAPLNPPPNACPTYPALLVIAPDGEAAARSALPDANLQFLTKPILHFNLITRVNAILWNGADSRRPLNGRTNKVLHQEDDYPRMPVQRRQVEFND